MDINSMYPSKYLRSSDLQGKEPIVTITQITSEPMKDGIPKPCLYFNNRPKGIVLNKTNGMTIASLYGPNTDGWIGKRVKLVVVWTEYQGTRTQGIRVVSPATAGEAMAAQAPQRPQPIQGPVHVQPRAGQPVVQSFDDPRMGMTADVDPFGDDGDDIPF